MRPKLLLFALVVLTGCQEIVDAPDLPYVERMVVYSIPSAGEQEISVSFTRTLPINEFYTLEKAALSDVVATIEVEGREYPLHYDSLGVYRTSGLIVKSGSVYALHAVWRGKACEAQTRIPEQVVIDSLLILNGASPFGWPVLRAVFYPRPDETYALTWRLSSYGVAFAQEYGFSTLVRQEDARSDGKVNLDETFYISPDLVRSISQGDSLHVFVQAFDGPFYDYFKSRPRASSSDDIFTQQGGDVKWNVRGEAIGMFIGRSLAPREAAF